MAEFAVADVRLGQLDSTGAQIDTVYYKSGNNYAIFRTTERVVIQYADKPERADEQRSRFARLNLVRGEINGLIDGWRKGDAIQQSKAKLFDRRVADALEYAFESNPDGALVTLNAIKADVLAERTAVARSQYIVVSAVAVLVLAAITCYFASPFSWVAPFFKPFWAAAGFGGMGALFSIAIGIHDRSMGTDLQARQNAIDATLRVLIGALSAFILYLLLRTNIVSLKIGDADLKNICLPTGSCAACPAAEKAATCPATLLFAGIALTFLAGFAERWVGDMLNRLVDTVSANPLAGGPRNAPAPQGQSPGKNGDKGESSAKDDKGASSAKDDKDASSAKEDKGGSPAKDDKGASSANDGNGDSHANPAAPQTPASAGHLGSGAGAVATEPKIEGDPSGRGAGQLARAEDKKTG